MEVVSPEVAHQMQQEGKFLVEQQVLGHVYGITAAAVRKLQASGKLPVLDLDQVADVARLRAAGFQVNAVLALTSYTLMLEAPYRLCACYSCAVCC